MNISIVKTIVKSRDLIATSLLFTVIIVILTDATQAQTRNIKYGNRQWTQYYLQIQVSKKWAFQADGGLRWANSFDKKSQYIAQIQARNSLRNNIIIATGLSRIGNYKNGIVNETEMRPFQEVNVSRKIPDLRMAHRFRFEERFFHNTKNDIDGENRNFSFRFRYRLALVVPLLKSDRENLENKISLNVSDEMFINSGRNIKYNRGQNRFQIGPNFHIDPNLTVTVTYNSQIGTTKEKGIYNYVDILWLGIRQKIDFSNKH